MNKVNNFNFGTFMPFLPCLPCFVFTSLLLNSLSISRIKISFLYFNPICHKLILTFIFMDSPFFWLANDRRQVFCPLYIGKMVKLHIWWCHHFFFFFGHYHRLKAPAKIFNWKELVWFCLLLFFSWFYFLVYI